MRERSFKSFAKINISLAVTEHRSDGYHELDSIMVPIELHDSIIISGLNTAHDHFITVDDFECKLGHFNLVGNCIDALGKKYKFNNKFRVYIHKNIPMQAGLGGGSSNAACTMKAVTEMLKLNVTSEEIIKLATPFGADIPFFVDCKPARANGIGEKLTPIEIKNDYYVVLVKPKAGCSTKEIFALVDSKPYKKVDIDNVVKALKEGDDDLLAKSMGNSLEDAAIELVPEIKSIKEMLYEHGFKIVGMSGSGSTVFALTQDKSFAKKVAVELENKTDYFVEFTKIIK